VRTTTISETVSAIATPDSYRGTSEIEPAVDTGMQDRGAVFVAVLLADPNRSFAADDAPVYRQISSTALLTYPAVSVF
jgi:hypothetical protein